MMRVQKVLKYFLDRHCHQIINGNLIGRVQSFNICLQSIHRGLAQQIVSDMADAVRPMALPWVLLAPSTLFVQYANALHNQLPFLFSLKPCQTALYDQDTLHIVNLLRSFTCMAF